jgi:hypothetical protein
MAPLRALRAGAAVVLAASLGLAGAAARAYSTAEVLGVFAGLAFGPLLAAVLAGALGRALGHTFDGQALALTYLGVWAAAALAVGVACLGR